MREIEGYMVKVGDFRSLVALGVALPVSALVGTTALTVTSGVVAIAAAFSWARAWHLSIREPTKEELEEFTDE